MLVTLPKSRLFGKPLSNEDAQSVEFIVQVGNVIAEIDEAINDAIGQFGYEFEIEEDDYIRESSARHLLIRQVASFLLQRPVGDSEIIKEHILKAPFGPVDAFFYSLNTNPASSQVQNAELAAKNAELTAVRNENARLERELELLRREKLAAEEAATTVLRRTPSRRNKQSFTSLDDYVNNMLKSAVADAVADALGKDNSNV